ncbi:amino acid deaminase [Lentzea flaviverrucosa]|uniref:D-serine deaminase, pyridoxal phosphate-dependent n=1 Tax=Lentzea flaviverrucosa TaxID=200379 RepID=A0A1H9V519_9PSEU|nr:amino acid deaminase [Lentzea flaviverrucosa]RDI27554.1 D-serine deaminase-like pyridoxal phosphate-dependent protein [Lentzea flaviverrucosa]SES16373.1 D-serine deaminase, pyridoxal phosphate-dependent [Lentzea flaviverrucosa]
MQHLMEMDLAAVEDIRSEQVSWRFKGLPSSTFGSTIGEVAARRLDLFGDEFVGPFVVLDEDALAHNLTTMAKWCDNHGVKLAPHGKTTMAPQLFRRQVEHGVWGLTAANASQLRVYRAFGVNRVLLANQLLDPAALRWLVRELDRDPGFEFSCWADSEAGVALMSETLQELQPSRPVDVLVELGAPGGRTGARDLETALGVARAVAQSPVLRLVGAGGYEGALAHDASESSQSIVDRYLTDLRTLVLRLADGGLLDELDTVIVTAGGSAYFDQVATTLSQPWPMPVTPVLRSGAYITHDDGFYRGISPFARIGGVEPFRPALRAWAQVTSRPQRDLALLTIGKRDASFDEGLPEPQLVRRGDGAIAPLTGARITALNDQHAFLQLGPEATVRVGDWIGLGLSHPCTVFDKWQLIPVVQGTTVVDLIRTYF